MPVVFDVLKECLFLPTPYFELAVVSATQLIHTESSRNFRSADADFQHIPPHTCKKHQTSTSLVRRSPMFPSEWFQR